MARNLGGGGGYVPHIAGGASVRRHEWPCPVFTCARYGTGRGAGDNARTKVLLHFGLEMQSSSLSPAQLAKVAANRARAEALTSERQLRDGVSGAGTAGAGASVGDGAAAVRHLLQLERKAARATEASLRSELLQLRRTLGKAQHDGEVLSTELDRVRDGKRAAEAEWAALRAERETHPRAWAGVVAAVQVGPQDFPRPTEEESDGFSSQQMQEEDAFQAELAEEEDRQAALARKEAGIESEEDVPHRWPRPRGRGILQSIFSSQQMREEDAFQAALAEKEDRQAALARKEARIESEKDVSHRRPRPRGRGGKGRRAVAPVPVGEAIVLRPEASVVEIGDVDTSLVRGEGGRLMRQVQQVETQLAAARQEASRAHASARSGIMSRAIGTCVAQLKSASEKEAQRRHRRLQDLSVREVAAIRQAKQQRLANSRQHNQGQSADGSFQRGSKRKRGGGKNHDSDRRAAQSRRCKH